MILSGLNLDAPPPSFEDRNMNIFDATTPRPKRSLKQASPIPRIVPLLALLISLTPLIHGCQKSNTPTSSNYPKILCTTQMIAEPVRKLLPPDFQVEHLMGSGVDPHLYKPTPEDLRKILRADLVLYHGHHLEGRMSDMLSQLETSTPRIKVVAVCEKIPADQLLIDDSGVIDPHLWLDVTLWKEVCTQLKTTLAKHGEFSSVDLEKRYTTLNQELDLLHKNVITALDPIPSERRVLVTAHDAFAYFGQRYGFEVYGIQGISTESEPSLMRVNQLVKLLSERNIPSIFVESTVPERNVRALQEGCAKLGHRLRIGGKLYSDAPGPIGSGAGSWSKMVIHNAQTIAAGLK